MKCRTNRNNLKDVLAAAEEGLQAVRVGTTLVSRLVEVPEPTRFTAQRVARVRRRLGVDPSVFAKLLGTSPATVQAWERGLKTPSGVESRLLEIAEREPDVLMRTLVSAG